MQDNILDSWQSGDPYEYYMGRWSKLIASKFIEWISAKPDQNWLDVGCGSGALSEAIVNKTEPAMVVAIDQSAGFVTAAQRRLGDKVMCKVDNALSLSFTNEKFDVSVSGLVLNFLPDPKQALSEMRRVTQYGGTVAAYIWNYAGKMEFLHHFWDAAAELNPEAATLHEAQRFVHCNPDFLVHNFKNAGITKVETTSLEIVTRFRDFDDYWNPFLGGQGPAPTYVSTLSESDKVRLKDKLRHRLASSEDGSISLIARAWACKGKII